MWLRPSWVGAVLCATALVGVGCGKGTTKTTNHDMAFNDDLNTNVDLAGVDLAGIDLNSSSGDMTPTCTVGLPCTASTGSGLCVGGTCAPCTDGTDDATCNGVYNSGGPICLNGACTTGCDVNTPCTGGQVCIQNVCSPCSADSDCAGNAAGTICNAGVCVTNTCVTANAMCPLNDLDECCTGIGGNSCVSNANCCGTGACTVVGGSANDGTCVDGQCQLNSCPSPSPGFRYVDPGSAAGGSGSVGCPYKTLTPAITDLMLGGTIVLKGATMTNVSSTIELPPNTTLTGSDNTFKACTNGTCPSPSAWPTIEATANVVGIEFPTAGGRTVSFLNLAYPYPSPSPKSTHSGFNITAAATPNTLTHLRISGFYNGIQVGDEGTVTINNDVQVTNTTSAGLNVISLGKATVNGGATFDLNHGAGIAVSSTGTLNISATAGNPVDASGNDQQGVQLSGTGTCTITGLNAMGNGAAGLSIADTGASITVRSSTFTGNNYGVHVNYTTGGSTAVTTLDFGKALTGTDAGKNIFGANTGVGLCIDNQIALAAKTAAAMLPAEGNTWRGVACTGTANPLGYAPSGCNVLDDVYDHNQAIVNTLSCVAE